MVSTQLELNCLMIESIVTESILTGFYKNEDLVKIVNKSYTPKNDYESELYSTTIIYTKLGLLN
jgi:hypothetical protein